MTDPPALARAQALYSGVPGYACCAIWNARDLDVLSALLTIPGSAHAEKLLAAIASAGKP